MSAAPPSDPGAWTPERIQRLASAFQQSRVLLSAVELGVFGALGEARRTSADLARELGTDPRGTDRLLNALCALGLLEKDASGFLLVPGVAPLLAPGGLQHTAHLWQSWSGLTDAVRRGGTPSRGSPGERGEAWRDAFIGAMHARGRREAPRLVERIDLAGVSRVLDVGGGSGVFAMAFARAREGVRCTVFDLPEVVPLTRRYLDEAGLADRIDTVAGDFLRDPLPRGYDLVFLSAIVHAFSLEQNRALVRNAAESTHPGGRVILSDFVMEESRTEPAFGAFFALNMLVNTEGGDTFTESEIRSWMEEAGLTEVKRLPLDGPAELMVGTKD